ncbi:MAG TPA: ROK family protein [Methylotenera sp.]|nr:ROK family protein [Methylotenera sp.]HPH04806.1 ROK family protein [Methylotenera sp.]HPN01571.1 ROK family protein [Methylotenera sp.]
MALAIGIDVGGTNLRIGVFDGLQLVEEARFQADFSGICQNNSANVAWQQILNMMEKAIRAVLAKHDAQTIGIGFPGFIDPVTKTIAQSPNLAGLKSVNLAANLGQRLAKNVIVENDANAAAYGEYCLAGKPEGGLIYLGLGTGVGGGLILNGKPFAGQHGTAMEVGHIIIEPNGRLCGCGNLGCMEQYASASGVAFSYFNATQKKIVAAEIAKLAAEGDSAAIAAFELAANGLAQALASILKVLDVQTVMIGGGLIGAWPLMKKAFSARLEADLIAVLRNKIDIKLSTSGDVAGMLGAAALAQAQ